MTVFHMQSVWTGSGKKHWIKNSSENWELAWIFCTKSRMHFGHLTKVLTKVNQNFLQAEDQETNLMSTLRTHAFVSQWTWWLYFFLFHFLSAWAWLYMTVSRITLILLVYYFKNAKNASSSSLAFIKTYRIFFFFLNSYTLFLGTQRRTLTSLATALWKWGANSIGKKGVVNGINRNSG